MILYQLFVKHIQLEENRLKPFFFLKHISKLVVIYVKELKSSLLNGKSKKRKDKREKQNNNVTKYFNQKRILRRKKERERENKKERKRNLD